MHAGERALLNNYRRIVNAVAKDDAALAERLLFEHVIDSRKRLRLVRQDGAAPGATNGREAA